MRRTKKRNGTSGWLLWKNLLEYSWFIQTYSIQKMLFHTTSWALKWCICFSVDPKVSFKVFNVFRNVQKIVRTSIHSHMTRRNGNKERFVQNVLKIYPEIPFDMRISNSCDMIIVYSPYLFHSTMQIDWE